MCKSCAGQNGHWSDERLYEHYNKLAFWVMRRFVATYKIDEQEVPDFQQEMIRGLLMAKQSYRGNSGGMYMILRQTATKWVNRYRDWSEAEDTGEDETPLLIADDRDFQQDFNRERLAEQVKTAMRFLPDPERICLTFHYGIDATRPLSLYMIARKLGVTSDWVKRRLARGEYLLKKRVAQ